MAYPWSSTDVGSSLVEGPLLNEEFHCLTLLEALLGESHIERDQKRPTERDQQRETMLLRAEDKVIQGKKGQEACFALASSITDYITKLTEKILSKLSLPERPKSKSKAAPRPSAHLTLRDSGLQGPVSLSPQRDLHRSCRYPLRSWGHLSFGSHLYNMSLSHGRLRVPSSGRYHLYAQVYFRYVPASLHGVPQHHSQQLVLCVNKKTSYGRSIALLKGVATKCSSGAMEERSAQSIRQGGLFELRTGDELFVSVSSPADVHPEDASSYFGASKHDP